MESQLIRLMSSPYSISTDPGAPDPGVPKVAIPKRGNRPLF